MLLLWLVCAVVTVAVLVVAMVVAVLPSALPAARPPPPPSLSNSAPYHVASPVDPLPVAPVVTVTPNAASSMATVSIHAIDAAPGHAPWFFFNAWECHVTNITLPIPVLSAASRAELIAHIGGGVVLGSSFLMRPTTFNDQAQLIEAIARVEGRSAMRVLSRGMAQAYREAYGDTSEMLTRLQRMADEPESSVEDASSEATLDVANASGGGSEQVVATVLNGTVDSVTNVTELALSAGDATEAASTALQVGIESAVDIGETLAEASAIFGMAVPPAPLQVQFGVNVPTTPSAALFSPLLPTLPATESASVNSWSPRLPCGALALPWSAYSDGWLDAEFPTVNQDNGAAGATGLAVRAPGAASDAPWAFLVRQENKVALQLSPLHTVPDSALAVHKPTVGGGFQDVLMPMNASNTVLLAMFPQGIVNPVSNGGGMMYLGIESASGIHEAGSYQLLLSVRPRVASPAPAPPPPVHVTTPTALSVLQAWNGGTMGLPRFPTWSSHRPNMGLSRPSVPLTVSNDNGSASAANPCKVQIMMGPSQTVVHTIDASTVAQMHNTFFTIKVEGGVYLGLMDMEFWGNGDTHPPNMGMVHWDGSSEVPAALRWWVVKAYWQPKVNDVWLVMRPGSPATPIASVRYTVFNTCFGYRSTTESPLSQAVLFSLSSSFIPSTNLLSNIQTIGMLPT